MGLRRQRSWRIRADHAIAGGPWRILADAAEYILRAQTDLERLSTDTIGYATPCGLHVHLDRLGRAHLLSLREQDKPERSIRIVFDRNSRDPLTGLEPEDGEKMMACALESALTHISHVLERPAGQEAVDELIATCQALAALTAVGNDRSWSEDVGTLIASPASPWGNASTVCGWMMPDGSVAGDSNQLPAHLRKRADDLTAVRVTASNAPAVGLFSKLKESRRVSICAFRHDTGINHDSDAIALMRMIAKAPVSLHTKR